MSSIKAFKKGEYLFKEGEKATAIYVVQSGSVSVCLARQKKNIELFLLSSQQVVGDQALQGAATHAHSAVCASDVKAIEIPIEILKPQIAGAQQGVQVVLKSLVDRIKGLTSEIKSLRLERESIPVPEDQVARALGAAYHAAQYRGKKEGELWAVSWLAYRQHAQRVLGESPKRLEQMVSIFAKLKLATLEMGKDEANPDMPETLQVVRFNDLNSVEVASDFYQHWYFKGGRTDLLKVEDGPMNVVVALLKCCEGATVDRHGQVSLEYGALLERMKSEFDLTLKPDHWARLEQKGLFARLKQSDSSVTLQVEIAEFRRALATWRILREIEKLNERGYVDMTEVDAPKKKSATGHACPECQTDYVSGQKFCVNCGHKLAAAA